MRSLPRTALAGVAAAGALGASLSSQAVDAQANVQRCYPNNIGHVKVVDRPRVRIYAQTCVIRFHDGAPFQVKAWVHTRWQWKTRKRPQVKRYTVETRLEMRNIDMTKTRCRYAADIRRSRTGQRTCEVTPRVTNVSSRWFTGDGRFSYIIGSVKRTRGLHGSPAV